MKNLIIMAAVLCCSVQIGWAQRGAARSDSKETRETRQEMLRDVAEARAQAGQQANAPAPVGTLGEPDSFGKNALFLGTVSAGVIYVDHDCDPATLPLGPDDRCLTVPDPTVTTSATYTDLGRITIPGKMVSNVIYMINNHNTNWIFQNSTASNASGRMTYTPTITIESDALNDPAAIDPNTGNPMNGSYTTAGNGSKSMVETLFPGYAATHLEAYSRANTVGLSRTFFAALGLPTSVINQLYKKPVTIRLGAIVTVRYVTFGDFLYSARLLGN
jgi:hypothetical protein